MIVLMGKKEKGGKRQGRIREININKKKRERQKKNLNIKTGLTLIAMVY